MQVEQRCVTKFFVAEGMKFVEIIDKLNKHDGWDPLQGAQVYYWTKEMKSGRKHLSNVPPPGRGPDEGLDDCIAKELKEDPDLSARRIAKALNISFTTVRNDFTMSLEMKCYHKRWALTL
jgi:hypothetical protein